MADQHCCEAMDDAVHPRCERHVQPAVCPDALIEFSARFREYGLPVRDGGGASVTIDFCPWCGRRLPASQRDAWFDELERRGIEPFGDQVPAEFQDGRWLTAPPQG
ncbi:DUF6980 family protein [Streptomyces sp. NPDC059578]|uniref:DUF6980 family protein n=1 Tax=Streptomyces sp. NPDC059578 TaxID=3346874 RepID=UPI0036BCCD49